MVGINKNLIADLYCLRAGISAISSESERLKNADDRIKHVNIEMEDNIAGIVNYNSIVHTSKKTLKSAKHEYQNAKRKYDKKSVPFMIHSAITVCLLVLAGYLNHLRMSEAKLVFLYNVLLGAVLLFAVVELGRSVFIGIRLKPLRKQMKKAKQLMLDSKTWIEESKKGIKNVDEQNISLKGQKNEYGLSRTYVAAVSVSIAEALYSALSVSFGKSISNSYYSALDFIIDMIRSGKCDDVAAALIAVDSKKASGRFEEAAFKSHEQLLSYIDKDIGELSSELEKSYKKLSGALATENERAVLKLKQKKAYTSDGIDEAAMIISKSNSQEIIMASLQAQKSRSCFDMARDIDYILSADKAFVR